MAFLRRNSSSIVVLVASVLGIALAPLTALASLVAPIVVAIVVAALATSERERRHEREQRVERSAVERLSRAASEFKHRFATLSDISLGSEQPMVAAGTHTRVTGVGIAYIAAGMERRAFNFVRGRKGDGWADLGAKVTEGGHDLADARPHEGSVDGALTAAADPAAAAARSVVESAYRLSEMYSGVNPAWPGARYKDADRDIEGEVAWRETYDRTASALRDLSLSLDELETAGGPTG